MSQRSDELAARLRSLETRALDRFTHFAVEHLADPTYWIDEDGSIVYANVAACDLVVVAGETGLGAQSCQRR